MKIKNYISISLCLCIISFTGCGKIKKTEAEYERENWIAGFSDSINFYQKKAEEVEVQLNEVNSKIAKLLNNFEKVTNPREVTGYYILKGWKDKLPFTSTGIYARINENEKLELLATLGGSTFNQIEVGTLSSDIVPHDQAFNFRHERFNTVYFTGGKADSIAEYVNQNVNDKIILKFLEGKVKSNFVIPQNEKNMISQTWELFSCQKTARKLQKELWISARKVETFRKIMDDNNMSER